MILDAKTNIQEVVPSHPSVIEIIIAVLCESANEAYKLTGCMITLFLPYSKVDRAFWCKDST